jgi:hypothetical protein
MKRAAAGLALVIVGLLARGAAADCCCEQCGCSCQPSKVCRMVPDKKKVPKITYSSECVDVCVPGPSKICGYKCECEDDCTCCRHPHRSPIWQPTCARVRTRAQLLKKVEVEEVCSWKWVVEDLCPKCADGAKQAKQPGEEAVADGDAPEEELYPIAASPTDADAEAQKARLVSHSISEKLKRRLGPILSK